MAWYVSAQPLGAPHRTTLVSGPWPTQGAALAMVEPTKAAAQDLFRDVGWDTAWGTSRHATAHPAGHPAVMDHLPTPAGLP